MSDNEASHRDSDNDHYDSDHSPERDASPTQHQQSSADHNEASRRSADAHRDHDDRRSNNSMTPVLQNSQNNKHAGGNSVSRRSAPSPSGHNSSSRLPPVHKTGPLVATVSYPARQEGLTVMDFLDPSKPLVKSTQPLTKPKGPSFVDESKADERKQHHAETRLQSAMLSAQINAQRQNERKYLKAQYEFEREKKIAERSIYHKERCQQWSQRLGASPLAVDLVADNERIEEEAYIREREEKRRAAAAERRKQRIKRAIIVKALAEVPLLEKARKEKRELVEGEKRDKALRDVQRVEAVQERKLSDQELMVKERQARLDQRAMNESKR